ncbi:MAG: sigma-54-dependent Fis family transcriptional regulator [Prevotella sp.]|nr:sigma-54-dependent Fis family transcriptional regulator [Prevotella sp.]
MILIVDDDRGIRTSLRLLLERNGYEVAEAKNKQEAMNIVWNQPPELILMDMNFSPLTTGEEGLQLLRQVKETNPLIPVILMTAWGSIELAVRGMKTGASDFITKPWNNSLLLRRIETTLRLSARQATADGRIPSSFPLSSPQTVASSLPSPAIIGRSPQLLKVMETISLIAPTNASVLITGESGTGKELIAQTLHQQSQRAKKPFVKVNLGGMSQSLFESEMFGYRKGAFTGAVGDRKGRFEMADGGTIFLDEIGDLDMGSQVKLLRVLQEQTFEPLGTSKPLQVDVRVVSATNAPLQQLIQEGRFREDLFYRINLISVHLPALRERPEDIPLLVNHFTRQAAKANALPMADIADDAIDYLRTLTYPGNIRQLKNLVERTVLISRRQLLTRRDFERQVVLDPQLSAPVTHGMGTLDEQERDAIVRMLEQHNNNISRVAEALGISRGALYRRMEKYNIKP